MIGTYRKVVVYTLTLIIARLPSIMYASDITGLTATANGYTWTYTLFDGNTAGLVSCTPEPEGRLIIPSGLDIEVLKNGVLITHVPVSSIEKDASRIATGLHLSSSRIRKTSTMSGQMHSADAQTFRKSR